MFASENVLRTFRAHPDRPGAWLFKEDWPLGGVWEIDGRTTLDGAEMYFKAHPVNALSSNYLIDGVAFFAWLAWKRRTWLKRHARRVPRDLWDRAAAVR